MSTLASIGTVLGVIAAVAVLVAAIFAALRNQSGKTKDDTIAGLTRLREVDEEERKKLEARVSVLEGQVRTLTQDFAKVISTAVVQAMHEAWPALGAPRADQRTRSDDG